MALLGEKPHEPKPAAASVSRANGFQTHGEPSFKYFRAPRAGLACRPRGLDGWARWMADKRERGRGEWMDGRDAVGGWLGGSVGCNDTWDGGMDGMAHTHTHTHTALYPTTHTHTHPSTPTHPHPPNPPAPTPRAPAPAPACPRAAAQVAIDPAPHIAIWLKAHLVIVAFILQPLQKELAERLADINHTLSGPGTSILSSSTIGILDSLAE